ncbi:DUF4336 domain-containing protein [Nostoc sp. MG11]|uniref:DUF4336 domain-containing protein n=1 Tax=Nostoc sp. MG11 TaxID=2721166 RepID=UPI00186880D0|nr:DUF4336 domain-containing protein [Nostoc sp. MG11]
MADDERADNIEQVHSRDFSWQLWPVLPLYPYGKRRTIRKEVVKDTIWTFDQLQGIFYVVVPIRMTVVKLDDGGLFVYAPVAPTPECIRLVNELVAKHGNVRYIILPTISGLEHKVFVGPFARCFPNAQVFVAPNQWSFPLNLPLSWLGLPPKRTQVLPQDSTKTPFADQFDYAMLGPIDLGPGKFAEVAFFHKRSHTLLVTDSVISIPEDPPAIVQLDPYPLLFHAKDKAADIVADIPANRRKGWQRISLFALYFQPSTLEISEWGQVFRDALKAPERSNRAYFGLFPFKWRENWQQSFYALQGGGRLFVAPILQTLILNRAPRETIDWADQVASWDFQWIVPCHFDSPIKAAPHQFRQAFSFLEKQPAVSAGFGGSYPLPEEDFEVLRVIDTNLYKLNIVPSVKEKV